MTIALYEIELVLCRFVGENLVHFNILILYNWDSIEQAGNTLLYIHKLYANF